MARSKTKRKFDFGGYATRNNIKCTDGRVIRRDAFAHQDGEKVPLVWQHLHDSPDNILGHGFLENRPDGVYVHGVFNDSPAGLNAKTLVEHGDIDKLSIYANQLQQQGPNVLHGAIREVSLVMSGANLGAVIDNISIQHDDGFDIVDEEAIIYTSDKYQLELRHSDEEDDEDEKDDDELEGEEDDEEDEDGELEHSDGPTVQEVFDTMNEDQKTVVYAMLASALEEAGAGGDNDIEHEDKEGGNVMKRNVFDRQTQTMKPRITLDQATELIHSAKELGSWREAYLAHKDEYTIEHADYGIENIEYLFPEIHTVTPTPEMISREMGWVQGVLSGTRHVPFNRIRSTAADITADEARAKGYVKGNLKKEEVIKLLKRETLPKTVYKKQKLDKDDIDDITDLDVVAFLWAEMRVMLNEEVARAILIGDGREADDVDKIDEDCIRPIWTEDDMYAHHVKLAANATTLDKIESVVRARKHYKGSGNPTFYTTVDFVIDCLLLKDEANSNRRLYNTKMELAAALGVNEIVEVEVMEGQNRVVGEETLDLIGELVNLSDYTVGATKGGQISTFEDFDIDYNQYKYLIETRLCGALTKPKSAVVVEQVHVAG